MICFRLVSEQRDGEFKWAAFNREVMNLELWVVQWSLVSTRKIFFEIQERGLLASDKFINFVPKVLGDSVLFQPSDYPVNYKWFLLAQIYLKFTAMASNNAKVFCNDSKSDGARISEGRVRIFLDKTAVVMVLAAFVIYSGNFGVVNFIVVVRCHLVDSICPLV